MIDTREEAFKEAQELANENGAPVCVLDTIFGFALDETPTPLDEPEWYNVIAVIEPTV